LHQVGTDLHTFAIDEDAAQIVRDRSQRQLQYYGHLAVSIFPQDHKKEFWYLNSIVFFSQSQFSIL